MKSALNASTHPRARTTSPMTDAEREEQARNFVAGNVGLSCPEVTREIVDRVCDELGKGSAVE